MILQEEAINGLDALIQSSKLVKIDNVIIEDGKIRGIDADKQVVIISDNAPDIGKFSMGLNRLDALFKKLALTKNQNNFKVELIESEKSAGVIAKIKITSNKTKAEFRTANPANIKAPKGLNDEKTWKIDITEDNIDDIIKSANAMGTAEVIISKNNGIYFEFVDDTVQDSLSLKISDTCEYLGNSTEPDSFVHYYNVKALMPLLKNLDPSSTYIEIGEKGMLWIKVNGLEFTVIPRVG